MAVVSVKGFTLVLIKNCNEQTSTDLLLFLTLGVKCLKEPFCTFYRCFRKELGLANKGNNANNVDCGHVSC